MHQLYNKRLGKCKGVGEGRKHDEEKKEKGGKKQNEKKEARGEGEGYARKLVS